MPPLGCGARRAPPKTRRARPERRALSRRSDAGPRPATAVARSAPPPPPPPPPPPRAQLQPPRAHLAWLECYRQQIPNHITSRKCPERPEISTVSAWAGPSFPCRARSHNVRSHSTPTVTWAPWVPVSTKKVQPNRFVCRVSPSRTNELNSYTCPPRKRIPRNAVANSQIFVHLRSPRCTAASASTIIKLDMRRSKVLTDVNGMLRMSCGYGPTTLLPL